MLAQARDALAQIHPDFPWVFLTFALWLSQYLVRRFLPQVWFGVFGWFPADLPDMTRRIFQALPSVLIGASLASIAAGGNVKQAVTGAFFGALAPLWHHVVKAIPFFPYQGDLAGAGRTPAPPPGPA